MSEKKYAPHQQRVVDEHTELNVKADALECFIGSEIFNGLDEAEQARLEKQHRIMGEYSAVLWDRISNF